MTNSDTIFAPKQPFWSIIRECVTGFEPREPVLNLKTYLFGRVASVVTVIESLAMAAFNSRI